MNRFVQALCLLLAVIPLSVHSNSEPALKLSGETFAKLDEVWPNPRRRSPEAYAW